MNTKRRPTIPPMLKSQIWETYMPNPKLRHGPCYVCGNEISTFAFECGHVKPYSEGGATNLKNLRPICGSCNKSMGTMNLEEYKQKYYPKDEINLLSALFGNWNLKLDLPTEPTKDNSCSYIYQRGKRSGQVCGAKVNNQNDDKCTKHQAKAKPKDKTRKICRIKDCSRKTNLELYCRGHECKYVYQRGSKKGETCGKMAKTNKRCGKHL